MVDDSGTVGRRPRKRVTSADVARASGVSRATVSYVLNDVPGSGISEATRRLVRETAERLGHVPHAPARTLRSGRSGIVLALVRSFAVGYIADTMLRKLDVALAERGYAVLVHRIDEDVRSLTELWGLVSPAMVVALGGVALEDTSVIERTGSPLVRVQGTLPHELAGRMQAEYLIGKGHRRLGYAFPAHPALELVAKERLRGVREACRELGVAQPVLRHLDQEDPGTVFAAIDAWTGSPEPVTAVCAHNDELALLIWAALAERGMRPADDLAVIGVDNIPAARVHITTIGIDVNGWGDRIVEETIAALDGRDPPEREAGFLDLIVRASA